MIEHALSARHRIQWAALGAAVLLGACSNGGGDGGAPPPSPPPPPSAARYHLVAPAGPAASGTMSFANGPNGFQSQALMAVPTPGTPGSAVTLEPAGRALAGGFFISLTLSGNTASNLRYHATVYARDGRLYKFEHNVPAGTPVQGQLLSSLATSSICVTGTALDEYGQGDFGPDISNAARSWLLLRGPGADRQCNTGDDVTHGVRLDMAATTPAVTVVGEPVAPLLATNGAFTGLVMRNGNQVFRVDGNLANASNLFTLSSPSIVNPSPSLGGGPFNRLWLFVDGNTLYGVRLDNPGTRVALATLTAGEQGTPPVLAADAGGAYVALVTPTSSRVLRVSDSLAAPTPLATFNGEVRALRVTPTRVVADVRASALQGLPPVDSVQSAPLAGGAAQSIVAPASGENLFVYGTVNEVVYALGITTTIDPLTQQSTTRWATVIVNADGSNLQRLADTVLIGATLPGTFSVGAVIPFYGFIAASPVRPGAFTYNAAGATLRLIEGSTRNTVVTYGSLPAAPDGAVFQLASAAQGQGLLVGALDVASGGPVNDLFYLQSDAPGITRVSGFITSAGAPQPMAGPPQPRALGPGAFSGRDRWRP
jgi:hypothetical protein